MEGSQTKKGKVFKKNTLSLSAERGGFEPPVHFWAYDSLANCSFRPLRHLSNSVKWNAKVKKNQSVGQIPAKAAIFKVK
jgi:hypothetical protein